MDMNVKFDTSVLNAMIADTPKFQERILDACAERMEGHVKTDPAMPIKTGALRSSIHVEKMSWKMRRVKDEVNYGVYQELGTSRGVPARHFMFHGYIKTQNEVTDIVKSQMPKVTVKL